MGFYEISEGEMMTPLGIRNLGSFTTPSVPAIAVLRRNNGSRSFVGLCRAEFFRGSLGGGVTAQLVDVVDDARLLRELLRFARQLQVLV